MEKNDKLVKTENNGRVDTAPVKRVELSCHTKMSQMDGVVDVKDLIKRAHDWGHKAVAITDHGVVQVFPDAQDYMQSLDKDDPFKVIYGMEGYLVDDIQDIAVHEKGHSLESTCVVFDLQTTGFSPSRDRIIEIGAVKVEHGEIVDRFSTYVNPKRPLTRYIISLTNITDEMVADAPDIETVLPQFLDFIGDAVLVAHNASFCMRFIEQNMHDLDLTPDFTYVDTWPMSWILLPDLSRFKLDCVAQTLGIPTGNYSRSIDGAHTTAEVFLKFIEMLKEQGVYDLRQLNQLGCCNVNRVKHGIVNHVTILAKNQTGLLNLYQLVSMSHLDYFHRSPRIPKSELLKHQEGLIIGSACDRGELFRALEEEKTEEEIAQIVQFYDYLEIQPIVNNRFMMDKDSYPNVNSEEDLRKLNRQIVKLGEQFNKPVVATGNVHYLDPEDKIYLRVVKDSIRHDSYADNMPPLYLRTTEEMLEEFSYLGPEKAKEIVIDNTNLITDEIKKISPILIDRCWPEIENAEEILRDSCYAKAHDIYGDDLPSVVAKRLERELDIILSNGWATLFVAFREVVLHSKEAGYLVGSRGCDGASLVAFMAGITEVNPLRPHYICPKCHYTDFDPSERKKSARMTGFDLPDRICPCCGNRLKKDGFDIPMETFFGLGGDKEPDIDLNFSGEFQRNAQQYVETIFGKGQTVFGGTIGTWSKIRAEAAARLYFENHDYQIDESKIRRVAEGCVGVRRTTGMHPGRILVIPQGEEISSLTPLQHPDDNMDTDIITTHFDYHAFGSNLMCMDLLGHDDPTVIRTMEDYINSPEMETGYDDEHPFSAEEISLDDQEVISLFIDTSALGISPDGICGVPLGCLGVPEFGTEYAMDMLQRVHPENLSDLIQVAALSHGVDVWKDNAECLIKSEQASLPEVIGTRDDIMNDLIRAGMGTEDAYEIMEMVRKGYVARGKWPEWPEYREKMRKAGMPDWYIASCEKILYLFPRAHAAGYTVMSYRIAYCKIHYPLAFYGAYFAFRSGALSYEKLLWGIETIRAAIPDYEIRFETLSERERDELKEMKVLLEMKVRGFDFVPIDLNRAQADRCLLTDGKLMPPLESIYLLASKEAASIEEAAKDGPFLSKEDFVKRTGLRRVTIDMIVDLGLL